MKRFNTFCEMDIASLINTALNRGNIIQPDSNIGQSGVISANIQQNPICISKKDDGSIIIKSNGLCVKLDPEIISALSEFLSQSEESEESEESGDNNEYNV